MHAFRLACKTAEAAIFCRWTQARRFDPWGVLIAIEAHLFVPKQCLDHHRPPAGGGPADCGPCRSLLETRREHHYCCAWLRVLRTSDRMNTPVQVWRSLVAAGENGRRAGFLGGSEEAGREVHRQERQLPDALLHLHSPVLITDGWNDTTARHRRNCNGA
jgi:hypothetical protein